MFVKNIYEKDFQEVQKEATFSFGRNWFDYVNNVLDRKQLDVARDSLLKYLPEEEYKNKVFIDIGCGSGIFSLSALMLGCKKVISFDVDEYSVKAAKLVKDKFAELIPADAQWDIFEGSILDDDLLRKFSSQGDIVYSWGVLHHTGDMYKAIQNASRLVNPEGFFILAIYNKTASSDFWKRYKRFYNLTNVFFRKIMNYVVFGYIILQRIRVSMIKKIKNQPTEPLFLRERGMSIYYDVVDWLGGYPYEYATFEEIKDYMENLGFELIKSPTVLPTEEKKLLNRVTFNYTGNNEFVFRKKEEILEKKAY